MILDKQEEVIQLGSVLLSPDGHCRIEYSSKYNLDYFVEGYDRDDPIPPLVSRVLAPGNCAIDVGANVGLTTVMASRKVGPSGHVHAFEALSDLADILGRNIKRNRCDNVTVHMTAVSDQKGAITFYSADPGKSAGSSVRERPGKKITVPTITLDSMLNELPHISLVKIDVEGAEFMVLRGMNALINRDHPYIILELTDKWLRQLGSSASQLCEFLRDHGYEIYKIGKDENQLLERIPEKQQDILCVHESGMTDAINRGLITSGGLE